VSCNITLPCDGKTNAIIFFFIILGMMLRPKDFEEVIRCLKKKKTVIKNSSKIQMFSESSDIRYST
jgi:hypothetical protein